LLLACICIASGVVVTASSGFTSICYGTDPSCTCDRPRPSTCDRGVCPPDTCGQNPSPGTYSICSFPDNPTRRGHRGRSGEQGDVAVLITPAELAQYRIAIEQATQTTTDLMLNVDFANGMYVTFLGNTKETALEASQALINAINNGNPALLSLGLTSTEVVASGIVGGGAAAGAGGAALSTAAIVGISVGCAVAAALVITAAAIIGVRAMNNKSNNNTTSALVSEDGGAPAPETRTRSDSLFERIKASAVNILPHGRVDRVSSITARAPPIITTTA